MSERLRKRSDLTAGAYVSTRPRFIGRHDVDCMLPCGAKCRGKLGPRGSALFPSQWECTEKRRLVCFSPFSKQPGRASGRGSPAACLFIFNEVVLPDTPARMALCVWGER